MSNIPDKHILSIRPKHYLKQGPSHCGAFCAKAILEALGKDTKSHPTEYHPTKLGKLTGMTLGRNYYVNILKLNGVNCQIKSAKILNLQEKLDLLKSLLQENLPVMLRIGNGFDTNIYNLILGKIVAHWITLWGYDDNKKTFYIYDSGLPETYWNKTLPIGNTTRTYNEIARDWSFGKYQFWAWPFMGVSSFDYIQIKR